MADYTNGADTTEEAAPADDLRSTLAAAIAASEADAEPAPKVETPAEPKVGAEDPGDGEKSADTRQRGPDGKFLPTKEGKTDAETKPESEKEPTKAKAEPSEAEKADTERNADGTLKPLDQWSKQHKEIFAQATPQVQQFMLDRERQVSKMITEKLSGHTEFRKRYEPVEALFKPYEATMKEKGLTPVVLMEAWANVEKRLAQGDGVSVIQGLVSGYKIDKAQLAQALGLQATQARADQFVDEQGNPVDPENLTRQQQVNLPPELVAEIKQLRARQDAFDNAARAAHAAQQNTGLQRQQQMIDEFRGETDGKGNLLHPHFEEVENDMLRLAESAVASKQKVGSLKDLYETAVWANPATREKLRTAERQSADATRSAEAKAKAAKARAAGSSVTGTPGAGQAANGKVPQDRPLRAEIEEAYNSVSSGS